MTMLLCEAATKLFCSTKDLIMMDGDMKKGSVMAEIKYYHLVCLSVLVVSGFFLVFFLLQCLDVGMRGSMVPAFTFIYLGSAL